MNSFLTLKAAEAVDETTPFFKKLPLYSMEFPTLTSYEISKRKNYNPYHKIARLDSWKIMILNDPYNSLFAFYQHLDLKYWIHMEVSFQDSDGESVSNDISSLDETWEAEDNITINSFTINGINAEITLDNKTRKMKKQVTFPINREKLQSSLFLHITDNITINGTYPIVRSGYETKRSLKDLIYQNSKIISLLNKNNYLIFANNGLGLSYENYYQNNTNNFAFYPKKEDYSVITTDCIEELSCNYMPTVLYNEKATFPGTTSQLAKGLITSEQIDYSLLDAKYATFPFPLSYSQINYDSQTLPGYYPPTIPKFMNQGGMQGATLIVHQDSLDKYYIYTHAGENYKIGAKILFKGRIENTPNISLETKTNEFTLIVDLI